MLTNKQRKLFYILYEISKRDIIGIESENDVNRFVKDLGSAAYNYKYSLDEKKLFDIYTESSKNFKKIFDNFIKNLYYKLLTIKLGLRINLRMFEYKQFEYNKSLFLCNNRIYEGISFLIYEFKIFKFKDKLETKGLHDHNEIGFLKNIIREYSYINFDYIMRFSNNTYEDAKIK